MPSIGGEASANAFDRSSILPSGKATTMDGTVTVGATAANREHASRRIGKIPKKPTCEGQREP
jgi:hypothetical protein